MSNALTRALNRWLRPGPLPAPFSPHFLNSKRCMPIKWDRRFA